ncbi:hypothetical protein E5329_27840 [Petralouisia muris]|jgi:accessory gene regulator protein AgrB|uniref:Uncharacterized protein n=1 Tax=Petralouisia muris TaxID=3032872 RepID=A0AC61RM74_9FIRM|nr:accessory gene regulator B family protein [Petralouisia muris]TGY86902.1 hypothetical protein E5329_27840 [Petralouisia muris]
MRYLSEKITCYIIKTGAISDEWYEVYQYGFQIGLEMLSCMVVCCGISIYLHMIPEFIVFIVIFILLRSYAGGIHLNTFFRCFLCSVTVQIMVLLFNKKYIFSFPVAWVIILSGAILILKEAPVESINRELEDNEKRHCKKVTRNILIIIILFSAVCTLVRMRDIVSLISLTVLQVLFSQYMGIIKYKFERKSGDRE